MQRLIVQRRTLQPIKSSLCCKYLFCLPYHAEAKSLSIKISIAEKFKKVVYDCKFDESG